MITDGKLQLATASWYGGQTADNGLFPVYVVPAGGTGDPLIDNAYAVTTYQCGQAVDLGVVRDLGVGEPLVVAVNLLTLPSGGVPATFSFEVMLSSGDSDLTAFQNKGLAQSPLMARDAVGGTFDEVYGMKVVAGDWIYIMIPPLGTAFNAENNALRYLRVVGHQFWNGQINSTLPLSDASGTCAIYIGPASKFFTTVASKTYPAGAIN